MVVSSGQFLTSGAALSHLDLMLWLLRQISPELAGMVANYLVVDSRPSQSAYIISDHLAHSDPLVEQFDRWVRDRIGQRFSLDMASQALTTSKRTLSRHVYDATGKTPVTYVQDLRIERAVHLLKTSSISVDEVADQVGYTDAVTLRTLLRRRLGKGIREIRRG
jgi:transcriptional regulator GlxA family with amidase domain